MPLGIDYAWSKPTAANIHAAGYSFVMRYLSHDESKDLSLPEAQALRAQGLGIGLVWETTASRAGQGQAAGAQDGAEAKSRAADLGYPTAAALYFAVDYDADPAVVLPYFRGVQDCGHPVGVYGSARVVESGLAAGLAVYGWQTCAWSHGQVSSKAHLYQRLRPTMHPIKGVQPGSYDENIQLAVDAGLWLPGQAPNVQTDPDPSPVEDDDMVCLIYCTDNKYPWVIATGLAPNPIYLTNPTDIDQLTKAGAKKVRLQPDTYRQLAALSPIKDRL